MTDKFVPTFITEQFELGRVTGHFQAATLFVDLSGYTPLTEALMCYEKDGAEELANALRAIFTPLTREVYLNNGLIPLFAGDGFTAIFPRETNQLRPPPSSFKKPTTDSVKTEEQSALHAAARAVDCALTIQRWMVSSGRIIQTKYGDFDMAAAVGLSYGNVQWGIPGGGDLHTFYFRGEAVDNCAKAQHKARAGELIGDQNILTLIQNKTRAIPLADEYWRFEAPPNRRPPFSLPAFNAIKRGVAHGYATTTVAQNGFSAALTIAQEPPSAPSSLIPEAVRHFVPEAIHKRTADAEFREVCVLFLSFQETVGIEELHQFMAQVMELTNQFGGIVNQLDFGDKGGYFLLLFGAPITHENDVSRAAEMLLTLREQAWSLPWRAGMDYGTVWAGMRGGSERIEYGVAGLVVNMAARLSQKAPWDEIWVGESVTKRLQQHHVVDSLGPITVKGRKTAQPIFRLLRAQQEETQTSLYPVGIVERDEELSMLSAWIQPLFDGRSPGILLVQGEAGIGKSRLIQEWRRRITAENEILWVSLTADATARRELGPFRHAMRRYFTYRSDQPLTRDQHYNKRLFERVEDMLIEALAGIGPHAGELIEALARGSSFLASLLDIFWADSLYERMEPKLRFENLVSSFKTLIIAESMLQPVILLIEDLHNYDEESIRLLRGLIRNSSGCRIAFLGTMRPSEDGSQPQHSLHHDVAFEELNLPYLSWRGVRHYASIVLRGELADELVDLLATKTNGNPFFVEQLALGLLEQGKIERVESAPENGPNNLGSKLYSLADSDPTTIPSTLGAVMMARLDRLEPNVKEVVQTASVLGPQFDAGVLGQMMAGDGELFRKVREAQHAQIWKPLEDGERYQFEHALLCEAAYDMQLRSRLRRAHQQAAEAIQRFHQDALTPYCAQIATHYDKADVATTAATWYSLAGEQAVEQFANEDAIHYISRGLDLAAADDLETHIQLTKLRERVYDIQGERTKQEQDLLTLYALAAETQDQTIRIELALRYGHFARVTNDYENALELFREAVGHAIELNDQGLESESHFEIGRTLWQQGLYRKSLEYLQVAQTIARQNNDSHLAGKCLYDIGIIHYYEGEYHIAFSAFREARAIFQDLTETLYEGNCLGMLGTIHNKWGDYLGAQEFYEDALAIYQSISYRRGQSFILGYMGNNYFDLGDYQRARKYHKQALHHCREVADREGEAVSLNTLGLIRLFEDDFDEARSYVKDALAIQRAIDHRRGESYSLTYLGFIDFALKNYESALDEHHEAIHLREQLNAQGLIMDNWGGLAEIALAQANTERALGYVNKILIRLDNNGIDGIEFPTKLYLVCFRVLETLSQSAPTYQPLAQKVLQQGCAMLKERADAILDDGLRSMFLNNIASNRILLAEADRFNAQ